MILGEAILKAIGEMNEIEVIEQTIRKTLENEIAKQVTMNVPLTRSQPDNMDTHIQNTNVNNTETEPENRSSDTSENPNQKRRLSSSDETEQAPKKCRLPDELLDERLSELVKSCRNYECPICEEICPKDEFQKHSDDYHGSESTKKKDNKIHDS
ncbi:uncharacterized protein LOC116338773 [Contarinia nasturtii]|uniref:uncharacterized protein LOC116338773 n=1 Tax=Contarinia nasturtii TaxID=265458 RepID=UPI0012D38603|nr:uncharacterized protein LOC116338773 [Contarinia nasturtii]XP_031620092.1 uncharacterized protein LOC116338773 [Contarinia nasturtii]XP_031620093.1 uncharacterized protein LOC116338773 [Contarinia nasturtii]XP_031620094.1 uncharacterized protein LOC116338773 [Contarinia nasturtii]